MTLQQRVPGSVLDRVFLLLMIGFRLGWPKRGGERESLVAFRHVIGYRSVAVTEVAVAQRLEHLRAVFQCYPLELLDTRH